MGLMIETAARLQISSPRSRIAGLHALIRLANKCRVTAGKMLEYVMTHELSGELRTHCVQEIVGSSALVREAKN